MSLSWRTCFRFAVFLKPRPPRCCGELMLLLLKEMLGLVCSRTWIPQFPSNLSITKRSRQLEFLTSSCRNQSSSCLFDLMLTLLFDPSQTLLNLLPLRLPPAAPLAFKTLASKLTPACGGHQVS